MMTCRKGSFSLQQFFFQHNINPFVLKARKKGNILSNIFSLAQDKCTKFYIFSYKCLRLCKDFMCLKHRYRIQPFSVKFKVYHFYQDDCIPIKIQVQFFIIVFRSSELKAYLTFTDRLLCVIHLSIRLSVNFSHFLLLPQNH